MNKEEFAVNWQHIRGQAQQWWSKLTDDDLERVDGKMEKFVGLVQERYGFTHEAAEEELRQRMAQFDAKQKHKTYGDNAAVQDILEGQWKQMHSQARMWWDKLTDDELEKTAGKAEAVFALLQAEYGMSRDRAEAEFKRRVKEYDISQQKQPAPITMFILG